jgi:hypothetical protein
MLRPHVLLFLVLAASAAAVAKQWEVDDMIIVEGNLTENTEN